MKRFRAIVSIAAFLFSSSLPSFAADGAGTCTELFASEKYKEAFAVCTRDADKGSAEGQGILGIMYTNGTGIERDVPKGIALLEKGASRGVAAAQYALGIYYWQGPDGAVGESFKDPVKAYAWFSIAADNGLGFAASAIGYLSQQMTPAQIKQGERRIKILVTQYPKARTPKPPISKS